MLVIRGHPDGRRPNNKLNVIRSDVNPMEVHRDGIAEMSSQYLITNDQNNNATLPVCNDRTAARHEGCERRCMDVGWMDCARGRLLDQDGTAFGRDT
jgi:hypothetical protein